MMNTEIALYISLISVFFGWVLGTGSTVYFDYRTKQRTKKEQREKSVIEFITALNQIETYLNNSYLLDSLKDSYNIRTVLAKKERRKEVYEDMKYEYHRLTQKALDLKLTESDVIGKVNSTIKNCLIHLKHEGKFISWAANRRFEYHPDVLPDYSECANHRDVEHRLYQFQYKELPMEMSRVKGESAEIIEYLSAKYIGRLFDVSEVKWYIRWYHRIRLKHSIKK
jgi:hypothetical protein